MTTRFDSWLTSQQELPEICPSCEGENTDEGGEWITPAFAPFCSAECSHKWDEQEAESERRSMTCPKCHRHFDQHIEVTKVDDTYGDYQDFLCPLTAPPTTPPYVFPEGPPNPASRTMTQVVESIVTST
jgi:hypothetical protein